MSYSFHMTDNANNVSNLRPLGDEMRSARAAHIHGLIKSERWSIRQAALQIGMNHGVLASRMNGSTPFLADELESLARLLNRDPVEFYAEYLKVGPTGLEPMTSTVESGRFATDWVAPVTALRHTA